VSEVSKVFEVSKVSLDLRDSKACEVSRVYLETKEISVLQVLKELKVHKV
jgi:hypothetical protein